MRPFLKWPGGKYRLIDRICAVLRPGKKLIEPFTGSGAVFLNTQYDEYVLADRNPDLINLYRHLLDEDDVFISYSRRYFVPKNNLPERFYALREQFNRSADTRRRSALFLYLNRHCYNGLCRYNSKGEFNSPFGRYLRPYFPEAEMRSFITAARRATLMHADFLDSMRLAGRGDVVYCDPPYAPLSASAHFTDYHVGGFAWTDQLALSRQAQRLSGQGVQVVISNHDTPEIQTLYRSAGAHILRFDVRRTISCNTARRERVGELLTVFG
ncbi:MAG: Dam family site-specific DNA-(adenine-N6)-methyltransferase [Gammaproteobacteria bacterium]